MSALLKAIEICGTQTELARRMGGRVRTGHIYHWLRSNIPAERCADIERATAGQVTRYDLRPDVFGAAPAAEHTVNVTTDGIADFGADCETEHWEVAHG